MVKTLWIFTAILIASCSKHNQTNFDTQKELPQNINTLSKSPQKAPSSIWVLDEQGTPVPQASILIGSASLFDFETHPLQTDETGHAQAPSTWISAQPVTIFKEGYVYLTHLSLEPGTHTFQIQKKPSQQLFSKTGKISGFGDLKKDGHLDFGLTIPNFTKQDLLHLDLSKMISPELESLSVLGYELLVPSNIFLPKQTESYGLFSFTIEKALFKILFDFPGNHRISANRGRFDFKKVADKMKAGKSYFEVVNDFQFLSFGAHDINTNDANTIALPTSELLNQKTELITSQSVGTNRLLYGIAVVENENQYSVVDIKLKDSQKQYLSYPQNKTPQVLIANAGYEKINKDVGKISESISTGLYSLQKFRDSKLLDLIEKPISISHGVTALPPKLEKSLIPQSTKILLSDIEAQTTPSFYVERKKIQWEIRAPGWISKVELPHIQNRDTKKFKRWDVIYYAQEEGDSHATHMVRNAVDFID